MNVIKIANSDSGKMGLDVKHCTCVYSIGIYTIESKIRGKTEAKWIKNAMEMSEWVNKEMK